MVNIIIINSLDIHFYEGDHIDMNLHYTLFSSVYCSAQHTYHEILTALLLAFDLKGPYAPSHVSSRYSLQRAQSRHSPFHRIKGFPR